MTVEEFVEAARNQQWCEWVLSLAPWERRFVYKRELEWFDDWAEGLTDLALLTEVIEAHYQKSVKV